MNTELKEIKNVETPKLLHHSFRFGFIKNMKVLMCRIVGHRMNNNLENEWCERCGLAHEEIYPNCWYVWIKKHKTDL